jgi:hypothetical protein
MTSAKRLLWMSAELMSLFRWNAFKGERFLPALKSQFPESAIDV